MLESNNHITVSDIDCRLCASDDDATINISTDIFQVNSRELIAIADIPTTVDIDYEKSNDDSDGITAFTADDRVDVIVKFDTACSRSMSGVNDRIVPDTMLIKKVSTGKVGNKK